MPVSITYLTKLCYAKTETVIGSAPYIDVKNINTDIISIYIYIYNKYINIYVIYVYIYVIYVYIYMCGLKLKKLLRLSVIC